MKEEWNKGYEKGRDDYCCNGDCNQGRDCPLRTNKIDLDFEEWKPLLRHIMENKLLKQENEMLKSQIKHLETQIYGGTTK